MYYKKYYLIYIVIIIATLVTLLAGIALKLFTCLESLSDILIAVSSGIISGAIITLLSQNRTRLMFILNKNEEYYQEIVKIISNVQRSAICRGANLKARDIVKNLDETDWENLLCKFMELTYNMRKIYALYSRVSEQCKTTIVCPDYNEIEIFENELRHSHTVAEKEKAISKYIEYLKGLQKIKKTSIESISLINDEINKFNKQII